LVLTARWLVGNCAYVLIIKLFLVSVVLFYFAARQCTVGDGLFLIIVTLCLSLECLFMGIGFPPLIGAFRCRIFGFSFPWSRIKKKNRQKKKKKNGCHGFVLQVFIRLVFGLVWLLVGRLDYFHSCIWSLRLFRGFNSRRCVSSPLLVCVCRLTVYSVAALRNVRAGMHLDGGR